MVMRTVRTKKMVDSIYKFIYFISSATFGYYVLKDQPFYPWALGGTGTIESALTKEHWPYCAHIPYIKEYILITMGYHVGSFIVMFFKEKRNDFIDMLLHHIVACLLYSGFYLFNHLPGGTTIAVLHDIADVTGNHLRFWAETKY